MTEKREPLDLSINFIRNKFSAMQMNVTEHYFRPPGDWVAYVKFLLQEIERLRGKVSILKAAGQKQRKEIVGLREEVGQKEIAEATVELLAEKVVLLKKETHVIHRCGSCKEFTKDES